jgi:peptide/nickel transport system substrate-binding protein
MKKRERKPLWKHFDFFEKTVLGVLFFIAFISGTFLLYEFHTSKLLIHIPQRGGTFTEGIIGSPRIISPTHATLQAEHDIVSVVYAGLMTRDEEGTLIPELAEKYTINEEGTLYTFTLKKGLIFHDGSPLTPEDIVFTISHIQNPLTRSPLQGLWDGIRVEVGEEENTILFILPEKYAPFLEQTTLGILPKHLWSPLQGDDYMHTDLNIRPIGAGPFKIKDVIFDNSGIAISYSLESFESYALGAPYIKNLTFLSYRNIENLQSGFIEGNIDGLIGMHGSDIDTLIKKRAEISKEDTEIYTAPLLRLFTVFLNQNKQSLFTDETIRSVLKDSLPKDEIIDSVFSGYARPLSSPSSKSLFAQENEKVKEKENLEEKISQKGWVKNEEGFFSLQKENNEHLLSFTISTVNVPDMVHVAQILQKKWQDFGVKININIQDTADFTQNTLRPRNYEALLFGIDMGHSDDLYNFWHSSLRNDPGLNIAQFADIESDALLEKIRKTLEKEEREVHISSFKERVEKINPVFFLFAPESIYLMSSDVSTVSIHPMENIAERFDTIHLWHRKTDKIWPFLEKVF